jgi:hypothetical protein
MSIHLKLSPLLHNCIPDYDPQKGIFIEGSSGKTIRQILVESGVPSEKVNSILVNHLPARLNTLVNDGDQVQFILALGGG